MNGKIDKYEEDKDEDKVGATDYHPEEAYEAIRQKDNAAAWQVPLDAEGIGPQDYTRTGQEVADDIQERLARHPDIHVRRLQVLVQEGVVTLTGQARDSHSKQAVADLIGELPGVRRVENQLQITG